ncbi:AbrB/MazE/SpoVT family DNA-binding domain-containing protein [Pseudomonas salmasensis]|uniref:AbrB/MazE/SpoVT family DNA-binding domain-containing protein n=1 Tax=Pseudomonas salmasensis TaxID=2745514 RepID=UPI0016491AF2|nr:AbrB/MazE/SpoVT family DNA-binding domain-containing protein [Pseudomonas salmasensis]QXH78585.1 AbrB/MazE/SpoVT family DNA-binding domain-containing protein [Pseudomonas salmasensis]
MNPKPKAKNTSWKVCQDAADGTGDLIIPLTDDLLSAIKLASGDKLDLEVKPNGTIILTPVRA